jgi:hypothetical protein
MNSIIYINHTNLSDLQLFSWLVSIAEAFLQGHQDMGSVFAMAKDFLELHHQLLNDLQVSVVESVDLIYNYTY